MSRKRKNKDYRQMHLAATNEQKELARYAERKHGGKLDAEKVADYSVYYEALYYVYRTLLEMVVGELRRNIERRVAVPDDMVRNNVPYIAALLTLNPHACEDFMDVLGLMPEDFQNMFITDQLREKLDGLNVMTRDLNELSRQRMQILRPDMYAVYSEIAANPPIWMNTQHLFMPMCVMCCPIRRRR